METDTNDVDGVLLQAASRLTIRTDFVPVGTSRTSTKATGKGLRLGLAGAVLLGCGSVYTLSLSRGSGNGSVVVVDSAGSDPDVSESAPYQETTVPVTPLTATTTVNPVVPGERRDVPGSEVPECRDLLNATARVPDLDGLAPVVAKQLGDPPDGCQVLFQFDDGTGPDQTPVIAVSFLKSGYSTGGDGATGDEQPIDGGTLYLDESGSNSAGYDASAFIVRSDGAAIAVQLSGANLTIDFLKSTAKHLHQVLSPAWPSPVEITGYRIGDIVGSTTDEPAETMGISDELPIWVAVALDGVIVGYQLNDPAFDTMSAEGIIEAGHPELFIYNEDQLVVGSFQNGLPTITSNAEP
jgi:predicted heme/steroid binding protein